MKDNGADTVTGLVDIEDEDDVENEDEDEDEDEEQSQFSEMVEEILTNKCDQSEEPVEQIVAEVPAHGHNVNEDNADNEDNTDEAAVPDSLHAAPNGEAPAEDETKSGDVVPQGEYMQVHKQQSSSSYREAQADEQAENGADAEVDRESWAALEVCMEIDRAKKTKENEHGEGLSATPDSTWTVQELKAALKKHDLSQKGRKADLLSRLLSSGTPCAKEGKVATKDGSTVAKQDSTVAAAEAKGRSIGEADSEAESETKGEVKGGTKKSRKVAKDKSRRVAGSGRQKESKVATKDGSKDAAQETTEAAGEAKGESIGEADGEAEGAAKGEVKGKAKESRRVAKGEQRRVTGSGRQRTATYLDQFTWASDSNERAEGPDQRADLSKQIGKLRQAMRKWKDNEELTKEAQSMLCKMQKKLQENIAREGRKRKICQEIDATVLQAEMAMDENMDVQDGFDKLGQMMLRNVATMMKLHARGAAAHEKSYSAARKAAWLLENLAVASEEPGSDQCAIST